MSRKNVAVCITGFDWECESKIINGAWRRCAELDINLLIFSSLLHRLPLSADFSYPEQVVRGELEIFNLINYDILDGMIMLGETMLNEDIFRKITSEAKKRHIPLVNVNDPAHILDNNVSLSDTYGMELVMRHLTEHHGLRKIDFIGGFPGNPQTEERLAAYKKILAENNIPVEENRIFYGQFWDRARVCAEEIVSSGDIPEAVVCASDAMSFFVMDCFKEHGLRIPEDVIVTGFDGIKECEKYSPPTTTVRRAFDAAGVKAVDILDDIWNGRETPQTAEVHAELLLRQSCGCGTANGNENKKTTYNFYGDLYGAQDVSREFTLNILNMNTRFAAVNDYRALFAESEGAANFFKLSTLNVCICSNIIRDSEKLDTLEAMGGYTGLSETMINMFSHGNDVPVGMEFPASKLAPNDFLKSGKPVIYAFSPLYFRNSFLGYVSYEPSKIKGYGEHFVTWLMALSNNAGSFYMNEKLKQAVKQLDSLYVRDPLTGLYNRRGMTRYGSALIEKARETNMSVTVICTDIDNLKPINDLYGHEAGDNAILRTAEALKKALPEDSICTRVGGDEYCSILLGCPPDRTAELINDVDRLLNEYNLSSGLEYKVGCSCGFYCIEGSKAESIEKIAAFADEEMYKVKVRKKAMRKM